MSAINKDNVIEIRCCQSRIAVSDLSAAARADAIVILKEMEYIALRTCWLQERADVLEKNMESIFKKHPEIKKYFG